MLEIFRLLLIIINYCMQLPSFLPSFLDYKNQDSGSVFSLKQKKAPKSMIGVSFCKKLFSCFFLFAQMRGLFGNAGPDIEECSFSFLVCATLSTSKSTTLLRLKKQERLCKVTSKASTNL